MASPVSSNNGKRSVLRRSPRLQTHELNSEIMENVSTKATFTGLENENVSISVAYDEIVLSKAGKVDVNDDVGKSSSKSPCKQKKISSKLKGRRYPLRSSLGSGSSLDTGRVLRSMSKTMCNTQPEPVSTPVNPLRSSLGSGRVLRSMSQTKCTTQPGPVSTPVTLPVNPVTKGRKKRRNVKRATTSEFSVIRKRVRYHLTRMNYEQSLIDAYSGEGWKGQSAEKIRPEKELERAKSEILRCKFKIRELFQHLDSLSSEGRFEETLFDSEGQIDSDDIFCAKCGSKDFSTDNDIILCDGMCDRGFHQKCLNPPLLSQDIPLGDEGWLCPACDCKVDCIDLLSEFQGSNVSIKDTWEKVFPEAVAIANGDSKYDNLPSDDSEDYDYNPDGAEVDVKDHKESDGEESRSEKSDSEESDSDESDFTSASEDSDASDSNKQNENFGFPSDDSEDDDFVPDAPDVDKSIPKDGSSSDESDFTSDSDEFCTELCKTLGANKDSASSLLNLKPIAQYGEGTCAGEVNNYVLSKLEPGLSQENVLASGRRQFERLDYKRLYDETYGKSSSDSSDDSSEDEDWSELAGMSTPNRGKKYGKRKQFDGPSKANVHSVEDCKNSENAVGMTTEVDTVRKAGTDLPQVSQVHETTPIKTRPVLDTSAMKQEVSEQHHGSNGNKTSASSYRRLGEITTQKLYESFQENQYPGRQKKESLAQEFGLTYRQVDKWFINSRHSFRVSGKEVSPNGLPSENNDNSNTSAHTGANNKPDGDIIQSAASKGVKRKKPVPARQPKVEAKKGREDGGSINEVDEERQKAIARELRKMKQGR